MPEGITDIVGVAFSDCVNLKEINLPDTITAIGNNTFDGCTGSESVKLSAGVKNYNSADVFKNCISLKNVTIPSGIISLGSIFTNCPAITDYYS